MTIENNGLNYNTQRSFMVIPEYGRNVQNMIEHAVSIEDQKERNECAQAIIKVMGQLNPHLRDTEDYNHKLWAHLFIMSDFKLEVDSPYPRPSKESFTSKPDLLDYPQRKIRFGHYGKLAEDWIKAAIDMKEGEEKNALVVRIGNMLKTSYLLWNKDAVEDKVIIRHLSELSQGKLTVAEEDLTDTSEILKLFKRPKKSNNSNNRRNKNNQRRKK